MKMTRIGMDDKKAKELKPELINANMAEKNRRRSNKTLPPPKLLAYDENEPFIRPYLAWLFSVAVRPNCDNRYTKLLNDVYGGN